jgi:hypothetical protein
MTEDGILGLQADLGQPDNAFAPTWSLPNESFDGFFANLLEIGRSLLPKHDWLSFRGLLVNLAVFHRKTCWLPPAFLGPWQPGRSSLS